MEHCGIQFVFLLKTKHNFFQKIKDTNVTGNKLYLFIYSITELLPRVAFN